MIALLPELVPDCDGVVSGVLLSEVSDSQGTVGPVTASLQERLVLLVEVKSTQQLLTILEPRRPEKRVCMKKGSNSLSGFV